ncbi:MAG: T9SS type A sorting domain-containing protein [Candidatus Competibacteraceae bacterium]|nr:T9SS type A sorting domain-containing protein [Candidatus Competibacteraceae bacterium]
MKKYFGLLIFLLLGLNIQGQTYLKLDTTNTIQLAPMNGIMEIPVKVLAFDSAQTNSVNWQGVIDFYVLTDSMISTFQPPRLFYSTTIGVLVPSNTGYEDTLMLDVQPQEMRIGGNVIIVWPASVLPDVYPADSLELDVDISGFFNILQIVNSSARIYPNPSTEHIHINSDEAMVYGILMDAHGKMVRGISISGQKDISFSAADLTPGTYLLRIDFANGNFVVKPIIISSRH